MPRTDPRTSSSPYRAGRWFSLWWAVRFFQRFGKSLDCSDAVTGHRGKACGQYEAITTHDPGCRHTVGAR